MIPGGIDPHTHMDMPFGGTTSSDDFHTGTIAAAHGGTTTIIDFAIQQKGGSIMKALETWHGKANGKASIDYSFHMIVTDLSHNDAINEMRGLMKDEGVLSCKLFMAYPGVLLVDDATIFRAMTIAGDHGGLICMHAENGVVINEIVARALAEGKTAPKYHALTRPTKAEAEGVNRAIALPKWQSAPVYIVHLSCYDALKKVKEARDLGLPAFAETCPQYLFLDHQLLRQAGFGRRQVCDDAASAREVESRRALDRFAHERPAGCRHRSLPVLHERPKGTREGRFHENSERRSWRREPDELDIQRGRRSRTHRRKPICGNYIHRGRQDFWTIPEERHYSCGF